MAWSLTNAALFLGAFVLALLPVALYALARQRWRGKHDAPAAGRYRCCSPQDEQQSRG
jgi:hypothetical protein